MAQLPTTGPDALRLKWGQETEERDGRRVRSFHPDTALQEPDGYLHGGTAAAAVLSAARLLLRDGGDPTQVSVSLRRPVPLGDELEAVLEPAGDDAADVTIQRRLPPDRETAAVEPLVRGHTRLAGFEPAEDLADARQLAGVPIPEPEEHELFANCYVCGQKNGQGLQLLPGWHAPDRVVVSFVAEDQYDDGGRFSPEAACALLSCPTLWAVADQLDERPEAGALLAAYEVRFHSLPRLRTVLRTVGWAGSTGRHTEFGGHLEGRRLHGVSALVDEDGNIHATATATWVTVDEVPSREPGRPDPISEEMPVKGGRTERSPDDWGQDAPGRREAPGPRSWRPGSEPEPGRGAEQTAFEQKQTPRVPKKGQPSPQDQDG